MDNNQKPDPAQDEALPLQKVLEVELQEITAIRAKRLPPKPPAVDSKSTSDASPAIPATGQKFPAATSTADGTAADQPSNKSWEDVIRDAHDGKLVGLAFSGGGIRSATFNLGVLQALADLKLLYRIDYLSTVSGGGYIGSWLAAWTKREKSFAKVQAKLATNRVQQEDDKEPSEIRFLRMFSNYLTPKLGTLSGDTWATVGIYLRNVILIQTIVFSVLAFILLLPRAFEKFASVVCTSRKSCFVWLGVPSLFLLTAFYTILRNMNYLDRPDDSAARPLTKQRWVLTLVGAPLFATAILGALWLHVTSLGNGETEAPLLGYLQSIGLGALVYGLIWTGAALLGLDYRALWMQLKAARSTILPGLKSNTPEVPQAPPPRTRGKKFQDFLVELAAACVAGALAGCLYASLSTYTIFADVSNTLIIAVPSVLAIFLLAGTLHIGFMGTAFPDRAREWWGRLGGWLLLWGVAWVAIFWLALEFPHFIQNDNLVVAGRKALLAKYLTPAWIATTLGGVLAGNSKASGKPGAQSWKDIIARIAPYVFVVGLLCWISWGINWVKDQKLFADYPYIADYRLWWALVACAVVAALMSWRVDVNQFSLHMYYRNRLVRCFLGASNKRRSPNRFTGFDISDDLALKDLRVESPDSYDGPYPVINASLNLVKGKDLAWQERKAESFVMTPRFCGFDVWLEEQDSPMLSAERSLTTNPARVQSTGVKPNNISGDSAVRKTPLDRYGYRPTENYAFPPPNRGPFLGLAMGISGAAASPNMGFYSTPPVAFLMTVFNVRLGQWLGNPRNRRTYRRPTPHVGLTYLINELLAGTDDEADYVYLSDGGHFENLALYELVKRRCGIIIVCDAEADSIYGFGGLGNAIRKCRIDLGVDICLDVSSIAPAIDEPSKSHCAIGTIHYETVDADAPTGTIIYFKASLTGDESTDVENYAKTHPTFPHESTIDQWFSESQFESYRKLGYHEVISSILGQTSCGLAAARAVAAGIAPASQQAAAAPASPNTMRSLLAPEVSVDDPNTPVIERAAAHLASVAKSAAMAARTGHARKTEEAAANAKALSDKLRKELLSFGFESSELGDIPK